MSRGIPALAQVRDAAREMLAAGKRPVEVSKALGVHYYTVRNWANRRRQPSSRREVTADVPVERVERECLCCGQQFTAKGRFQRMCRLHRGGD